MKARVFAQPLHSSLATFFQDEKHRKELNKLIDERYITPRLIDYFVTQYARRHPIFIKSTFLDVHSAYKLQLKAYHKRTFNLFPKKMHNHEGFSLPLAKLNVYRWLIDNKIHLLILEHSAKVKNELATSKTNKLSRKDVKRMDFQRRPVIIRIRPRLAVK